MHRSQLRRRGGLSHRLILAATDGPKPRGLVPSCLVRICAQRLFTSQTIIELRRIKNIMESDYFFLTTPRRGLSENVNQQQGGAIR